MRIAKFFLPDGIIYGLLHGTDVISIFSSFGTELKLKLVPYTTISEKGIILGFTPSKITVDNKETKAIIGISSSAFSCDMEYDAIVNPKYI